MKANLFADRIGTLEVMVLEIKEAAEQVDSEKAHVWEDKLRARALRLIANGKLTEAQATLVARVALSTEREMFSRLYA